MMSGIFSGRRVNRKRKGKPAAAYAKDHPEIGTITVVISRRARRITLSVKPDRSVRLAIPCGVPEGKGMEFLDLKKEWVLKTQAKYPLKKTIILPPFSTRSHILELEACDTAETEACRIRLTGNQIRIKYPSCLDVEGPEVQRAVRKGIEEAWRAEAKEYLPVRLLHISNATGLKYRSVTIRNTVSKWGSCSARNDISLSLHLMRLPDHLIDYVLLHELCHTVHKNHGPGFHGLLDKLTAGRHLELRRELRNYHTRW